MKDFRTLRTRRFLVLYSVLWWVLLPVILIYLRVRGRKDPLYRHHIEERFGVLPDGPSGVVWIHAVSLGELRSAEPLIRQLIDRGERVHTTHFTPAGRREANRLFAKDIAAGKMAVSWVPFEYGFAYRRFFEATRPKVGLVMEIEFWPRMIMAARKANVPLFLCNAQYPKRSFDRDTTRSKWRSEMLQGLTGAFVKSQLQRDRFAQIGLSDVSVTGELRFDQAIPQSQLEAGLRVKQRLGKRQVIVIPSVVLGEDETYLHVISKTRQPDAPLFVYVPRAPERFDESEILLTKAGFSVARRSTTFDGQLDGTLDADFDVLLGDSMGEMYFYLSLSDVAIVGGSFVEKGAHNISEPLSLGLPCIVGPHTWTIEFPVVEALQAGVCKQVADTDGLLDAITGGSLPDAKAAKAFAREQSGATARTISALQERGLI